MGDQQFGRREFLRLAAGGAADVEVASQRGHDIFTLNLVAPAAYEDHVIDHREIVEEIEAKAGKMTPFVERTVFNPKTKKYLGVSDYWTPNPVHYRTDLWEAVGRRPDTWDDVLGAGTGVPPTPPSTRSSRRR